MTIRRSICDVLPQKEDTNLKNKAAPAKKKQSWEKNDGEVASLGWRWLV